MDDARNLFVQGACARSIRVARIEVVQRGAATRDRLRRRESGLVRRIIRGEQQVGLGQVLHMNERVGSGNAVADTVRIGDVAPAIPCFPVERMA